MNWSNERIPLTANALITEYDIRSGNLSIMKALNLKPEYIPELEQMPKRQRNVTVGLLQRDDKIFAKQLEAGFNSAVKAFILANKLDPDTDISDIRRDAVFVINKPIRQLRFASNSVVYRPKGTYHAFIKFPDKLSFYFPQGGLPPQIDGFMREDAPNRANIIKRLEPGMISFLEEFISVVEGTNQDKREIYRWLIDFAGHYKRKELDSEYYREFSRKACFRIGEGEDTSEVAFIDDELFEQLDISYNYRNIIIPLLQLVV